MMLKSILAKSKVSPELAQALTRMMIACSIMIVLFFAQFSYDDLSQEIFIATVYYVIFSAGWLVWTYKDPVKSVYRRILGQLSDIGILAYGMYHSNMVSIGLYPLLLWIVVANGFRYGTKYLYSALIFSLFLFSFVTYNNPHWQGHHELILMLIIGLVALSLLFSFLLNQVTGLNDTLSQKAKDLEYRLYHDSLTHLKNREALERDFANSQYYALSLVDVNNFSHFNDLYGNEIGNDILQNIGKFLTKLAYKYHFLVYRIDSDSFIFIQKEAIDKELFSAKMQTVLDALEAYNMRVKQVELNIAVRFTVVTVFWQKKALEKANMALHFARKKGERYWIYDKSIDRKKEVQNILSWEKEVYDAILEDRIIPVFHPIVDKKGNIVKYETLMRLEKIKGQTTKIITPHDFLEIAMQTNQYEKLTTIMIEKSFDAMQDKSCDFSLNLTFSNMQNKKLVNFLKEQIKRYAIGKRLILEIVESEDIYNFEIVKTFVEHLRAMGVRFAIDDFGSGYANYRHIFEVKPEYIKLDGSLIQNIDKNEDAYKFVASIVRLAQDIDTKIIAEFVHNQEIFNITKKLGVDEFQGSYFYKPVFADAIV